MILEALLVGILRALDRRRGSWHCVYICVCVHMLSHVWLFATLWTVAHQAALSMEFSRQEHWSGLPFPLPGEFSQPRDRTLSLASPALAGRFFTTVPPGKPPSNSICCSFCWVVLARYPHLPPAHDCFRFLAWDFLCLNLRYVEVRPETIHV